MFCVNCGKEIPDGAKFCPSCGKAIEAKQAVNMDTASDYIEKGADYIKNGVSHIQEKMNSGSAVSDGKDTPLSTYAWLLGGYPVLLILLELLHINIPFIVIASVVVMVLDYRMLKGLGYNLLTWFIVGIFVTPVYLFMRAKEVDHDYRYAILWCVSFVIYLLVAVLVGA